MQKTAGSGDPAKGSSDSGGSDVPRVMAEFTTYISTDDDPWSPYGITFHSSCLSCNRKLDIHKSDMMVALGEIEFHKLQLKQGDHPLSWAQIKQYDDHVSKRTASRH